MTNKSESKNLNHSLPRPPSSFDDSSLTIVCDLSFECWDFRVAEWVGRVMVKHAPPAGWLEAVMPPPCSSMMRLEMLSPSPLPVGLLLAKGVNSRPAISG